MSEWIEIDAHPTARLAEIAALLAENDGHAFHNEPWHPGAYVVRVRDPSPSLLAQLDENNGRYREWDPTPDEELYGEKWEAVSAFFTASTKLGELTPYETRKLVHCFLNARGLSWREEIRFHLREAWGRIRLLVEIRLHVGPRYRSWKAAAEEAAE